MNHKRGKRISINPYCDYGNKIDELIDEFNSGKELILKVQPEKELKV